MIQKLLDFVSDHVIIFTAVAIVLVAVGFFSLRPLLQLYPFGPQSTEVITVKRLYVDVSGSKEVTTSSYMLSTDKGVFEMDNSLWLQIFNIDELYGQLEAGKTYEVTVKGNKLLNFFFQSYPHITTVKELE